MHVLKHPTPTLFFTGKGGVGKTSLSCATAVALADSGKKVLLVSTDPASNIHEVFGQDIGTDPTAIAGVDGRSIAPVPVHVGESSPDACQKAVALTFKANSAPIFAFRTTRSLRSFLLAKKSKSEKKANTKSLFTILVYSGGQFGISSLPFFIY